MNLYQMLKTISIITQEEQTNFWEQELYNELEFQQAFLDVQLLLKEGIVSLWTGGKIDVNEQEK